MKVCFIGNFGFGLGENAVDGGRIKTRLYSAKVAEEGHHVTNVDLDGWKRHPFSLLIKIFHEIKMNQVSVIMPGPNGSEVLLPLISKMANRKRRIVYIPLGTGILEPLLKKLTLKERESVLTTGQLSNKSVQRKKRKIASYLKKINAVIVQTETLKKDYELLFSLSSVSVLKNFRIKPVQSTIRLINGYNLPCEREKHLVYLSRVNEEKGIFDLLEAVKRIGDGVFLDIYGELQMSAEQLAKFNSYKCETIRYLGKVDNKTVIPVLSKYSALILPTKFLGEGTPGVAIEAFFAGTPVIISSFSQAKDVVTDNYDGLIFDIGSVQSLVFTLERFLHDKSLQERLGKSARTESEKYTYECNRDTFIYNILGEYQ